MAIVQNTLIGRTRKSIGNLTFCQWNGLNVIKGKLIHKKPQPLSDAVVLNRAKMTVAGRGVGMITTFCKPIYRLGTVKTTGFAEMVKFFRMKLYGTWDELKLEVEALVNSKFGSENCGGIYTAAVATAGILITCTIDTVRSNRALLVAECQFSALVVNETFTKVKFFENICNGDLTPFELDCSSGFIVGDKVYVWTGAYLPQTGADLVAAFNAIENIDYLTLIA